MSDNQPRFISVGISLDQGSKNDSVNVKKIESFSRCLEKLAAFVVLTLSYQ